MGVRVGRKNVLNVVRHRGLLVRTIYRPNCRAGACLPPFFVRTFAAAPRHRPTLKILYADSIFVRNPLGLYIILTGVQHKGLRIRTKKRPNVYGLYLARVTLNGLGPYIAPTGYHHIGFLLGRKNVLMGMGYI